MLATMNEVVKSANWLSWSCISYCSGQIEKLYCYDWLPIPGPLRPTGLGHVRDLANDKRWSGRRVDKHSYWLISRTLRRLRTASQGLDLNLLGPPSKT